MIVAYSSMSFQCRPKKSESLNKKLSLKRMKWMQRYTVYTVWLTYAHRCICYTTVTYSRFRAELQLFWNSVSKATATVHSVQCICTVLVQLYNVRGVHRYCTYTGTVECRFGSFRLFDFNYRWTKKLSWYKSYNHA